MPRSKKAADKPPASIIKTGGNWSPEAAPVYFAASNIETLSHVTRLHKYLLVAVNEIKPIDIATIYSFVIDYGCSVFIDSGVFNLSTRHAAAHDLTMNEALSLAPEEVDGFQDLFDRYISLIQRMGDDVWGYIEIDQGGRENKIKTRAKLEGMGLRPIPVYHPFNDGWDYFDYLASRYDRICLGNVVQADQATRKRLIATAWERKRKYPGLWIHALGLTPSDLTNAYPLGSCDSSTWISSLRWGTHDAVIASKRAWALGRGFCYDLDDPHHETRGRVAGTKLAGYDAAMVTRSMQVMKRETERSLGVDCAMPQRKT